jgi:hypothetical protein
MSKRNRIAALIVLLLAAVMLLGGCAASASGGKNRETAAPEPTVTPGPIDEAQRLADYIFEYGELPEGFLTKKEAQTLGWQSKYRYVSDAAPGMSIGGDYFGNYERRLPVVKGRKYYEADCFYQEGPRNEYRIIFSNDGHVWYTEDHYETFIELFPTEKEEEGP